MLLNKILFKEKDPGSFTIPCVIGKVGIDKALANLRANISLMPYSMYVRLDLRELKPTRMCIELANKSTQYPRRIAENVIIKIKKIIFPVDFVMLDMKEDNKIPIILGRPFLATAHAMVDEEEDNNSEDLDEAGLPSNHDNWEAIRPTLFSTNMIEAEKQPPKLKELPSHLEYAFLNNNQEFLIKDKKGTENLVADHRYRLENPDLETLNEEAIRDSFLDEYLMAVHVREIAEDPWYDDYANFLVSKIIMHGLTYHLRKKFLSNVKHYIWDYPYLFKSCPEEIIRRRVFGKEIQEILEHCHTIPTGGHYRADITASKIFESRFSWPTIFRDAARYILYCDACQRTGNISSRNQMPLTNIIVSDVFDIWGIDFMGPFPSL
ncbi:reverse transcriptase domain-containing protein [Tanacetum coccineum]